MKNDYLLPLIKASGLYHIDSHGRVWTKRKDDGPGPPYEDRWRRAEVGPVGNYDRWQVSFQGKMVYANRLVWFWFNGEIPDGAEIDHDNNDKSNHSPYNLQPLNHTDNMRKARRDGLIPPPRRQPDHAYIERSRKFWNAPGRKDQMSQSAKLGWEKRRCRSIT